MTLEAVPTNAVHGSHNSQMRIYMLMYCTSAYRLLRYQLKANPFCSIVYGVGTSPRPGLATGCLRYTAEHTL